MKKSIQKAVLLSLFASLAVGITSNLFAQTETNAPAEKKEAAPAKKPAAIPFRGKLLAVDKTAKTITVEKRTFQITSETKIFKGDKPAVLEDGVLDEAVTGSYKKSEDGKLIAGSVYFGGKGEAKPKAEPKKEMN